MEDKLSFDLAADEVEIFLEEANEHLQAMEAGILRLEQATDHETVNAIFRAAHTLKALAGTIGHQRMAELTHTMETLFDAIRSAKFSPQQAVIDDLLTAVDVLKVLRDEIISLEPSHVEVDEILARLNGALSPENREKTEGSAPIAPLSLSQAALDQAAQISGGLAAANLLDITVKAGSNAFAPAARLSQAAMALLEVGQVMAQQPTLTDLANGRHDGSLRLVLASQIGVEAIEELLAGISDLAEFRIQPYQAETNLPLSGPAASSAVSVGVEISSGQAPVGGSSPEAGEVAAQTPASPQARGTKEPSPKSQGNSTSGVQVDDKTVRISVERLDTLMNLVGELVTSRNRLLQVEGILRSQNGKNGVVSEIGEVSSHFSRVVDQLQEEVMHARMLPIASLFEKFPRIVRDVARIAGKQVKLVIEGEATELDRSLIEVIGDPLVHLLRNAIDHGLEKPEERLAAGKSATGTVRLSAAHLEGQIVITVEDDGKGIDPTRVRNAAVKRGLLTEAEAAQLNEEACIDLIFQPNLSTAEQVTGLSGRGVGMDVVRANVERLNGSVVVESTMGQGTLFRVTLPLTLAIVQAMLVSIREGVYAIPLASIIEALYLSGMSINTIKGSPSILWRNAVLPLLDLREFFSSTNPSQNQGIEQKNGSIKPAVVIVTWGKLRVGLIVDKIVGRQDIVVKALSTIVGEVPALSGGTILGDGQIALIIDVSHLINTALRLKKQVGQN